MHGKEVLLESKKKPISKEVLLLKRQEKISLDFLAKTGSSEGAELIICSVFCGVRKLLPSAVLVMGMPPACTIISVAVRLLQLLKHTYPADKEPPRIY